MWNPCGLHLQALHLEKLQRRLCTTRSAGCDGPSYTVYTVRNAPDLRIEILVFLKLASTPALLAGIKLRVTGQVGKGNERGQGYSKIE